MVGLLGDNVEDVFKVLNQDVELILLNELERHFLEGLGASGIVLGGLRVLLLLEQLIGVNASNVRLLRLGAILHRQLDVALLQVLFPRVLVFALEVRVLEVVDLFHFSVARDHDKAFVDVVEC